MKNLILMSFCVLLVAAFITPVAMGGPLADYGDAPDPTFPSRSNSGERGPQHGNVEQEWIGTGSTTTTTLESDSLQINADIDDGDAAWLRLNFLGTEMSYFATRVSYNPTVSNPSDTRYLNILTDLDGSGSWDGGNEWAVRNYAFSFAKVPTDVTTIGLLLQVPDVINPSDLMDKYTRVTLSDSLVSDGSGEWGWFSRGETEDWMGSSNGDIGEIKDPPILRNFVEVLPLELCKCGASCVRGFHAPRFKTGWRWGLEVKADTTVTSLELKYMRSSGCGDVKIDPRSKLYNKRNGKGVELTQVGGGWTSVPANLLPIVGPSWLDIYDYVALTGHSGHACTDVKARVLMDPMDEWWWIDVPNIPGYFYGEQHFDEPGGLWVPEPATMLLLGLGGLVLLRRRRK